MAAESVPMAVPGGGPVSPPALAPRAGGSQGGPEIPCTHSPSTPGGSTGAAGPRAADSSESRAARVSSDESAASRSAAVGSSSPASKPAGKPRAAATGDPSGESNSGRSTTAPARQADPASAASSAASRAAAQTAAVAGDFSAALAQSLAATSTTSPTSAAAADVSKGKTTVECTADGSSESPTKHSTADPASSALTLLEQALAGACVGIPSMPAVSSAAPAPASGATAEKPGGTPSSTKSSATALGVLLAQNAFADPKPGATDAALTAASGTAAVPTGAASTAAAALTAAAQLPSGSPVGLQQGISERATPALASSVGTSAWTEELGAKLTWMAHQGIDSASLRLSPEHLGPLQVTISVHNGQASVWFGAAQPDTRTALQQSLPQLRQLFASQGLTLTDAGVSREPPRGQHRQQPTRTAAPIAAVGAVNLDGAARTASAGGLGLLDTYA